MQDVIDYDGSKYDLESDGVAVYKQILHEDELQQITSCCKNKQYEDVKALLINNDKIIDLIHKTMGSQYVLQDYIWIIEKSTVHTCHRDNNGDFFNKKQRFPSYTMLIYTEDMEKCLGVIPKSHTDINANNVNILQDPIVNLHCSKGDIIIFNANLIHVGCINKKDDNLRIQMKITHKDDIEQIKYYQNYNKVLNTDNNLPVVIRKAQLRLSCALPYVSNLTQNTNIQSSRGSDNGAEIGLLQKVGSLLFYGDTDFYDLPNAF